MKKRILIVLSAILIFGMVAAAFAYTRAGNTTENASASCPMHKQSGSAAQEGEHKDSCCGMADCCKDGKCSMGGACCKSNDSCPMKQKDETKTSAAQVNVFGGGSGESCCKPGAECCKGGGACCKHKS